MKIDAEKSKIYSYTDQPSDLYMCGMLHTGNKGYFSNRPNFVDCEEGILCGVNVVANAEVVYYPFKKVAESIIADNFKFFVPEVYAVEKTETPELRRYKTLDELPFKVGDTVTFRDKATLQEYMLICVGTGVNNSQLTCIHLGAYSYEPGDLFGDFEWFNGKEWKPFGVEE